MDNLLSVSDIVPFYTILPHHTTTLSGRVYKNESILTLKSPACGIDPQTNQSIKDLQNPSKSPEPKINPGLLEQGSKPVTLTLT